ncbi:hypothetical protein [Prescottella subtropica]|uniref:hypothetical protein n=1 Tax=Prescottella subtropica TaxID=2545757 RepID=UPI0010F91F11|nr:hypothetical protein [Prescottella subtropica]
MNLRAAITAVAVAAVSAGCAGTGPVDADAPPPPPSEQSQIYATVLRQLTTVDNPVGGMSAPAGTIRVVDRIIPQNADLRPEADGPLFDEDVKREVTELSAPLAPVEFVTPAEQPAITGRGGVVGGDEDGFVVALDAPAHQDDGAVQVGASAWCGGDCGIWLTYVLDHVDGQWVVTGTTGPVWIA